MWQLHTQPRQNNIKQETKLFSTLTIRSTYQDSSLHHLKPVTKDKKKMRVTPPDTSTGSPFPRSLVWGSPASTQPCSICQNGELYDESELPGHIQDIHPNYPISSYISPLISDNDPFFNDNELWREIEENVSHPPGNSAQSEEAVPKAVPQAVPEPVPEPVLTEDLWTAEDGSSIPIEEPITAEEPNIDDMDTSGLVEMNLPRVTAEEPKVKSIEKRVEWSSNNHQWHVKSGKDGGRLEVTMKYNGILWMESVSYWIRLRLRRDHPQYQSIPINKVCDKHLSRDPFSFNPVMAAEGEKHMNYITEVDGEDVYLFFRCSNMAATDGSLKETFAVRFPCNDTCHNSTYSTKEGEEAARDSSLEIVLQLRTAGDVRTDLCSSRLKLWIKAHTNERDLNKPVRRKPKGSLAQLAGKKRRLEEAASQLAPAVDPQVALQMWPEDQAVDNWIEQLRVLKRHQFLTPSVKQRILEELK